MTKNNTADFNIRMTVYCALFTALIIIGGYISIPIPIGPVPIALADFFVMAAGLFLGGKYGLVSTALYIVLGILGLPVFAGGRAGLAVLFGPTGGFLIGYLLVAAAVGFITDRAGTSVIANLIALIVGNILMYAVGVPWLKFMTSISWTAAIAAGLTPFIAGIVIKIVVALALSRIMLPRFRASLCAASGSQPIEGDS